VGDSASVVAVKATYHYRANSGKSRLIRDLRRSLSLPYIVPQVSSARLPKYRCLQVAIYHLLFPEQRKRTLNTAFIRKRDLHSEVREYQKELMDGHI
jgi:hypothetical protein